MVSVSILSSMTNIIKNVNNAGGIINQKTTTIINEVNLLSFFRKLFNLGRIQVINALGSTVSVDELSERYFTGDLNHGMTVKTVGFLSRYAPNYKTDTFLAGTNNPALVVSHSGGKSTRGTKKNFSNGGQIPIQALPPIGSLPRKEYLICYLYPESFTSFLLELDPEKKKTGNTVDQLNITNSIKPIPVLLERSIADNYLEKYVEITGVISLLDAGILEKINEFLDSTIQEIYSNFYRPFSQVAEGVCIDCRYSDSPAVRVVREPQSLPAGIYLEAHLDKIAPDLSCDILRTAHYDSSEVRAAFSVSSGDRTIFSADDDIIFRLNRHGIVGLYTETDLINDNALEEDFRSLMKKHNRLFQSAKTIGRQRYDKNALLKTDFIFDYRRAKLFNKKALKSKDIVNNPELDSDSAEAIKWVNKKY